MKNLKLRIILLGLLNCYLTFATAAGIFPHGCEANGFTFTDNYLILNDDSKQTVYFLHNLSSNTIQLERHETRDIFMSPKLQSFVAPKNWSAFASDEKNLYFLCHKKNEEVLELVNCKEVLEVCRYPRAKFALSNMGNYWVSTNKSLESVIKEAVAKGIYLKW